MADICVRIMYILIALQGTFKSMKFNSDESYPSRMVPQLGFLKHPLFARAEVDKNL